MAPARSIADRLRRWLGRDAPEPAHLALGRRGEDLAAAHLRARGFRILRRNFRAPHGGEIDLVCRDGETLVFVEVKTRAGEEFGRPASAVDRRKRRLLVRAAFAWLRMLDMPDLGFRFDIVEVIAGPGAPELRHIENAFSLPEPFHY